MSRKRRILALIALFCAGLILLSGCGKAAPEGGNKAGTGNGSAYRGEQSDETTPGTDGSAAETRKVIVTATYNIEVKDAAAAAAALEQLAKDNGGYIESSRISGTDSGRGSAEYTLRIPVAKLGGFADGLGQIGNVLYRTHNEKDITDEYYDVDARVKALTAQRDRLLELIGKAASLSELLELEKALADVQGSLDSLTGQLKRYDSQVSMATVTVSLDQIGLTSAAHQSYGARLLDALTGTFKNAVEVVGDIFVALVWMLPLLLFVAVVIAIVLLATRKRRREAKRLREARQAYYAQTAGQPPQNGGTPGNGT